MHLTLALMPVCLQAEDALQKLRRNISDEEASTKKDRAAVSSVAVPFRCVPHALALFKPLATMPHQAAIKGIPALRPLHTHA